MKVHVSLIIIRCFGGAEVVFFEYSKDEVARMFFLAEMYNPIDPIA